MKCDRRSTLLRRSHFLFETARLNHDDNGQQPRDP
jgi:hypothetical protein